ncbi:MAG: dUTP diphosphatase, partial [Erysipelotrichaceae bacterium]
MKLYVKDLYEMQDKLDQRIFDEHGITRIETMNRRMLALLIEIGELANETRCFKFWSNKGASSKDVILEEYADGIHFLLSLGIDLKDKENEIELVALDGELSDAF